MREQANVRLYIGSISASPTACLLRGYGRAGTQNDRLSVGKMEQAADGIAECAGMTVARTQNHS